MTTRRSSNESLGTPPRSGLQGHALSWTDDLPVCHLSGVGFSTNQLYREDGIRCEEHEFEDKSFHFRLDNDCFLYGVFDGYEGSKASNFAAQRMPAELLLEQLVGKTSDEEINDVLLQAFTAVEKGFFESMDDLLATKANLQMQLPEGVSDYDAARQFPDIVEKLHALEAEISCGTTAVVVLVFNNKLYVANVGDSRAVLCKTDEHGVLRAIQLSADHTIMNEDEQRRLLSLGLDVDKLQQLRKIGNSDNTRCIGDYHVKGGHKEIDILSSAHCDPVIAEPAVTGSIPVDSSCQFLILMSDGLYQALQDATETDHVNADIIGMVVTEFGLQSTLNGVAQAVVDKVVRIHHDVFMMAPPDLKHVCQKRGDITLLVRNFCFPLPNAVNSPTGGGRLYPVTVPFYKARPPGLPFVNIPKTPLQIPQDGEDDTPPGTPTQSQPITPTNSGTNASSTLGSQTNASTNSTQSSGGARPFMSMRNRSSNLQYDKDGKIEPYVDFSDFYKAMDQLTDAQVEELYKELEPQSSYETIAEEPESPAIDFRSEQ